jgi:hypothetical protein
VAGNPGESPGSVGLRGGLRAGRRRSRGRFGGDPRFDLVRFAYDLDGHDQPVWDVVEATCIERRVLRAYVAHHALRCTSWQIHHHPDDVPRQLDRAERVLDRYEA